MKVLVLKIPKNLAFEFASFLEQAVHGIEKNGADLSDAENKSCTWSRNGAQSIGNKRQK